jgi:hypothetical protein
LSEQEQISERSARTAYNGGAGVHQGADWAEKAIEERDQSMMVYLRFAACKGLRASHRWPKIAKMLNLTK